MQKTLLSIVVITGLLTASVALASNAPLRASCQTSVVNNAATWKASASGGTSPYSFLWSGDGSVSGSTSTLIRASYSANGTYIGTIRVTDASSTVATTTCQSVVKYFPAPSSTSTTRHVQIKAHPSLIVHEGGSFVGKHMTVQSIGSGTFTTSVWGIAYTVTPSSSSSLANLLTGDNVTVIGKVSTSSPLAVSAKTIHNLSLVKSDKHAKDEKVKWTYQFQSKSEGKTKEKGKLSFRNVFDNSFFTHFQF